MFLHKKLLTKSTEKVNFKTVKIRQMLNKYPEFYLIPKIYKSPKIVPIPNYIESSPKPLVIFL